MSTGEVVYKKLALEALVEAIANNRRWADASDEELNEEAKEYLDAAERTPPAGPSSRSATG